MGRRARTRERAKAPSTVHEDPRLGALELRGAMTPGTRAEYAAIGGTREDAWQRRVEFLFERLAVSWTVSDTTYARQRELLGRFRMASGEERAGIRDALRVHVAEHFPDVQAP